MKIKEALNRIYWRFGGNGNKNPFPIKEKDVEAFSVINDYVEQTQKQQFQANHLFAKMYIFTFMRVLEKEGSTVYSNTAKDRVANILKKPIPQLIEDLTQSLNDSEKYEWMANAGLNMKHPVLRTEAEEKEQNTKFNELKEPFTELITKPIWGEEFVTEAMMAEVNLMINLYK